MTLEELIELAGGKGVEQVEALSDNELEEYFRPMFNVTRPVPKKELSSINGIVKPGRKERVPTLKGKALTAEQSARLKKLENLMGERLL